MLNYEIYSKKKNYKKSKNKLNERQLSEIVGEIDIKEKNLALSKYLDNLFGVQNAFGSVIRLFSKFPNPMMLQVLADYSSSKTAEKLQDTKTFEIVK